MKSILLLRDIGPLVLRSRIAHCHCCLHHTNHALTTGAGLVRGR